MSLPFPRYAKMTSSYEMVLLFRLMLRKVGRLRAGKNKLQQTAENHELILVIGMTLDEMAFTFG